MKQTRQLSTVAVKAKEIRKQLKALGYGPKHVSVRSSNYSMGSSISVTIKDLSVPFDTVKEIAEEAESISRCSYSGDILSGGNRYVSVSYDSAAIDPLVAIVTDELSEVTDDHQVKVLGILDAFVSHGKLTVCHFSGDDNFGGHVAQAHWGSGGGSKHSVATAAWPTALYIARKELLSGGWD